MYYQALQTSISWAKVRPPSVPSLQGGEPWNISSAAARKPSEMGSRQLLRVLLLPPTPRRVTTNLRPTIPKSWEEAPQTTQGKFWPPHYRNRLETWSGSWQTTVVPSQDNINTVATWSLCQIPPSNWSCLTSQYPGMSAWEGEREEVR